MSAVSKEGFLCPVCYEDLESVLRLQAHFEQAHQSAEDSNVIVQSFKGAIGRAKRVIKEDFLKKDLLAGLAGGFVENSVTNGLHKSSSSASLGSTTATSNASLPKKLDPSPEYDPETWAHQPAGVSRSHLQFFKKFKQNRSDRYATETNKLILRLDKLVRGEEGTASPSKLGGRRREYERAVVPWVDDSVVKLCPECARSFGLTNRRHHCRLCGMVMCQNCSCFVTQEMTRKLTSIVKSAQPNLEPSSSNLLKRKDSISSGKFSVSLNDIRDLTSSLKATLNPESVGGSAESVRVCKHCFALLSRRLEQMDFSNDKPELLELYDKLKQAMVDGESLVPQYLEMVEFLHSGHPGYNLAEAQTLRQRILKAAETVDHVSKKISLLGIRVPSEGEEEDQLPQPDPKLLQLQGQIRAFAVNFLRQKMIGLPPLPSRDQIEKAKEERAMNIQRKIAKAEEEDRRLGKNDVTAPPATLSWTPKTDSSVRSVRSTEDDPLLQQIRIIESYVDQAKAAGRMEEVATLEANLLELIEAFQARARMD